MKQAHEDRPVILALRRLRQEEGKFEASLGHKVRPDIKN